LEIFDLDGHNLGTDQPRNDRVHIKMTSEEIAQISRVKHSDRIQYKSISFSK
jgi:hypothetical protein